MEVCLNSIEHDRTIANHFTIVLQAAAMGPAHFRALRDLDGALVGRRLLGVDGRAVGVVGGGGRGRSRADEGPSINDVRKMVGLFCTPRPRPLLDHIPHNPFVFGLA